MNIEFGKKIFFGLLKIILKRPAKESTNVDRRKQEKFESLFVLKIHQFQLVFKYFFGDKKLLKLYINKQFDIKNSPALFGLDRIYYFYYSAKCH